MGKRSLPDMEDSRMRLIQRLSKLLDEQFRIGSFRFGIDPLLNLLPVVGDMSSYLISLALIITMIRHGASGKVAAKMLVNASLDAFIGAIPVIGWIFDIYYKANKRNVRLLHQYYVAGRHTGSAKPVIIKVLIAGILIFIILIILSVKFFQWLITVVDNAIGIYL